MTVRRKCPSECHDLNLFGLVCGNKKLKTKLIFPSNKSYFSKTRCIT
jgi:hypothetical protein